MTTANIFPETVRRVSPNDARAYARVKGWIQVQGIKGDRTVFRHNERELDQVIIPNNSRLEDYVERISDVIEKFAEIEERPASQILLDVLNHDADVIRCRIIGDHAERGSISLAEATGVIEGLRKSILSAAHSVAQPQRYHPRMSRREADQLLNACRFEQTERGSFVVAISCPLRAVDTAESTIFGEQETFTRATTRYLYRSLSRLSDLIQRDAINQIMENTEGQPIVSANLCDALLRARPDTSDSLVEYTVSWAPSRPISDSLITSTSIRFEADDYDAIEDAYLQLRPESEPMHNDFIALVDELRGNLDDDNRRAGDVTLSLYSRELEDIVKARVELSPEYYRIADQAHMEGGFVFVRGVLRRGRRISRITDLSLFRPVPRQTDE